MPTTNEDSLFFIPVHEVCHRPVVTCAPDLGLIEMARLMMANNISGIVVVTDEKPVGIVSLRDLRNLIAEVTGSIETLTVRDVMKTSLITIHSSDYLFKAIFLMAKHNIHRLIVVDESETLTGVITDADLMRIQTSSPLYLVQEIEAAGSIEQLRTLGQKMTGMLRYALKINADTPSLIQLIAHFNDALTQRLIYILDRSHDIRLPSGAAYLSLGSEGRQEQTLRTDQDSAIVYRDDLSSDDIVKARRFAGHIVSALETIGVPLCPGNMMASNPEWCHSLSEWKQLLEHWINRPDPDATVHFGVFQDLRVMHGDVSFEAELREFICECTRRNAIFFPSMARNIVRFKPPLGMFGRFQVEKKGDQRGKLDLKKGGLFALTRGVSLIALEAGITGGTTWSKLERLNYLHVVSDRDLETLCDAFTYLVKMRLSKQLIAMASGKPVDNYVDPMVLMDRDRDQLRDAFKGVETLLHLLKSRYQLDLMAR
ncbi:MAG: putative nucleotidyltransferase substrate binding domain-containing protein [Desulfuromonadaceae bacterium]|nr:putative nucleotidyltransferase substrate binding domain-containing protein [Desulfuromonadaceae bacterium]